MTAADGSSVGGGRPADPTEVYRIWPGDGVPPGAEGWDWLERTTKVPWSTVLPRYTRNVVIPTVTVHRPEKPNGTTLVVAPGGAFHFLMIDHEGHDMARWLNTFGVTVLVLKYRLARTPDDDDAMEDFRNELQARLGSPSQTETAPPTREFMREVREMGEEDGRQAIRYAREHAAEWGIDPNRIGIAGFSAGGGVAMGAAMVHNAASRPDWVVGVYPAWRAVHAVPANAPPLFLLISDDDKSIAPISSSRLYEQWHASGAPAELHVFGNGGHGWGMLAPGYLSDIWTVLLERWLRERGLIS
jgi:acetyl esterase/lipase